MDIYSCSLCGARIYPGHGSIFVKNNCKIFRFCKSKCAKLFHLKKNPFFLRWTSANRKIRGIHLIEKPESFEKMEFITNENSMYNSYIIFQTLFLFKREQKIFNFRCLDFKTTKKINLSNK
jgi:large subunit ribosomal protein L24e